MKSFDVTFINRQGSTGSFTFDIGDQNNYDAEFLEMFNEIIVATNKYDIKEITSVECWFDEED